MIERIGWGQRLGAIIAVLAVANVMSNRLLPAALYVPWNLAVAAAVLVLARGAVTDRQLGLTEWRRGFLVGMVLVVVHRRRPDDGAGDAGRQRSVRGPQSRRRCADAALPGARPHPVRHGGAGGAGVPVRAARPARRALRRAARMHRGVGAVRPVARAAPALNLNEINPIARDVFGSGAGGKAVAVVFAVAGTALAGLWFCLLRYRSRSVLAPMMAHVASNSIAYTLAYFVTRA